MPSLLRREGPQVPKMGYGSLARTALVPRRLASARAPSAVANPRATLRGDEIPAASIGGTSKEKTFQRSPVTWMYWGLFSAGKLNAEAEYLSCTNPNLGESKTFQENLAEGSGRG